MVFYCVYSLLILLVFLMLAFEKKYSKEQALQKLKHYCSYQERCHKEVRDKLYSLGLWKTQVEELLSQLIEENYLNEERFAIAFASGKFNSKHWGKEKIRYELLQKKVSTYCVNKAVSVLNESSYNTTFQKLANKKSDSLKTEHNIFIKKRKLRDYLLQKGYERSLIASYLQQL